MALDQHSWRNWVASAQSAGIAALSGPTATPGEYLVFRLGSGDYAIPFFGVDEIRSRADVAAVPDRPASFAGVLQARRQSVPVVDLRTRFGIDGVRTAADPVIVVTVGRQMLGLIVDAVSYLLTLDDDDILPAPGTTMAIGGQHIAGLGTVDARMMVLIDVESLWADTAALDTPTRQ